MQIKYHQNSSSILKISICHKKVFRQLSKSHSLYCVLCFAIDKHKKNNTKQSLNILHFSALGIVYLNEICLKKFKEASTLNTFFFIFRELSTFLFNLYSY